MIRCKLIEHAQAGASQSTTSVGRAVSGEVLSIGRAASCKVYLPNPSVRLDHATIYRGEDGGLFLSANGPVLLERTVQTKIRLALGQTISIGPYNFHIDQLDDAVGLATAQVTMTYSNSQSTAQAGVDLADMARRADKAGWITRRRLVWLMVLMMLVGVAIPLWSVYSKSHQGPVTNKQGVAHRALASTSKFDVFWNPGQISSAHQNFANDCKACHTTAFERVTDAACQACHSTVGAHIADKGLDAAVFAGQRCASCHKDHQGANGMHTIDAVGCVECHSNIRKYAEKSALESISDFAKGHPEFRLSVMQADAAGGKPHVQRMTQTASLKNPTGLKFPHDIHMARAGIKSPQGLAANKGRVVLECDSCHALDAAGVRYEPVQMDKHCQGCHRLSVDPQAPERQVPHGKPAEVAQAVRDIYASLAVERFPAELVTVNSLLQRPAGQTAQARSGSALRWVQDQSQATLVAMFEKPQGTCATCHTVQVQAGVDGKSAGWEIGALTFTQHWLPKSNFSHAQHKTAACADCHSAQRSKDSADILIPAIASCRQCHAGNRPDHDKVVSTCESCHGFHMPVEHPIFKQVAKGQVTAP